MDGFMRALASVWTDSGFASLTIENIIMILVGLVLLYLAIAKEYEPLLLMPIAFGDIMVHSHRQEALERHNGSPDGIYALHFRMGARFDLDKGACQQFLADFVCVFWDIQLFGNHNETRHIGVVVL